MTSGIKGTQGFQRVIDPQDILKVLTEKPMKNSTVLAELKKLDPEKYGEMTVGGVKKVLIKMGDDEKILGGYDEELRVYRWTKKEAEK